MRRYIGAALAAVAAAVGIACLSAPQAAADSPWDRPGAHELVQPADDSPWD